MDLSDVADAEPYNRSDLQALMWESVGLRRTAAGLREALDTLRGWRTPEITDAKATEDANLLLVARAVTASALRRTESRGGHFRADFPATDPTQAVHSGLVPAPDESADDTRSSASSTMALEEDAPFGDVTSQTFVPATTTATAELVAREPGIFAGAEVFEVAMIALDDTVKVTLLIADGDRFDTGQVLARVEGSARAILQAERVALNLVQRMCGVATLTARYVEAVAGTDARVVDTRKTTPGLRALERHAVRCGGGHNHRYSLSDAVMAKDNHLAVVDDIGAAIRRARAELPHTMHLEVEIDRLEQLDEVLAAGPDTIMLDNFSLDDLVEGVRRIDGRAIVEASGGITLDTIAAVAATGVDVISVGALTHSVRALDLGLDVVVDGSR